MRINYRALIRWLPLLILLVAMPFIVHPFYLYLIGLVGIYAICTLGVNILSGYSGQITVGHGGFFAIGAYTATLLAYNWDIPFLVGLISAGVVAAFIGFLLGFLALRVMGAFLVIATLGFAMAVYQVINNWEAVFQGRTGIHLEPATIGFITLSERDYYYFIMVMVVLFTLLSLSIVRSSVGRAFMSIRDSTLAAQAMGISLVRYKVLAFTISTFFVGIGGALWAYHVGYVGAEFFTVWLSVDLLVAIIIGGLGSTLGSLLGAAFIIMVPWALRDYADLGFILLGAAVLGVLLFAPEGMSGIIYRIRDLGARVVLRQGVKKQ